MTAKKYNLDGTINTSWKPGSSGKSGKSGDVLSHFAKGLFCCWDGEGFEIDGKHSYTLLANSNDEYIGSVEGLSTYQCLDFICKQCAKMDDRTIHVWFAMGYDINMMLGNMSKKSIAQLWKGGRVDYGQYNLYYRNRKELIIKRFNPDDKWELHKTKGWQRKYLQTVHMWDTFGFFQVRFTEALKTWLGGEYDQTELQRIESSKANRATFQSGQMEEITQYCLSELQGLYALCIKLHGYLQMAKLPIRRWDGAGAVAASMLSKENVRNHMGESPPDIAKYAQHAYAGGRIELLKYGYTDKGVHCYDINSAYPSAMLLLPPLNDGYWQQVYRFEPLSFGLWHVSYKATDTFRPCYPLFYRDKNGRIYYPARTEGIFWTPEVANAVEFHSEETTVHRGWVWRSSPREMPFYFVRQYYDLRKQWKKDGVGAQIVLKLGLNSLYGKMAQQLGGYNGKKPPFHQLEWAGYVTSLTRARLYRAVVTNPGSIVFMATDGIVSTKPLDIPVGDDIGLWEYDYKQALLAVQSGVYFYWKELGVQPKSYYRGFNKGSLSPNSIMASYRNGLSSIRADSTRFIGMGTALVGDRWKEWRTWPTVERTLSLTPLGTKRYPHPDDLVITSQDNPGNRLYKTIATPFYEGAKGGLSHPYPIRWLGEDWAEQYLDGIRLSEFEAELEDSYS